MPAGTLLTIGIDTDNNGSYDLSYQTTVGAGGSWSYHRQQRAPSSGTSRPTVSTSTPIRATATDPAGKCRGQRRRGPYAAAGHLTSGSRSPR